MTPIQYPGNSQEPAFTNDQVADMVLHKDDDTMLQNETHADEPQDRPAYLPTEEWTGDGFNNGDCWFPIHFTYDGINYTADVQQKIGTVKEFYVCGMTPSIIHLPDPYVVAEHFSKEKYDFPVNEMFYPASFGHAVIAAIEEGSNQELL